jgi:hypothetical protein
MSSPQLTAYIQNFTEPPKPKKKQLNRLTKREKQQQLSKPKIGFNSQIYLDQMDNAPCESCKLHGINPSTDICGHTPDCIIYCDKITEWLKQ